MSRRPGELALEFDCDSEIIHPDRVSTTQQLVLQLDAFDPPILVQDVKTQYSAGASRKASTVFGRWLEGSLRAPKIPGDRYPLVMEFLESVSGEREFIIRAERLPGVDRALAAFVPAKTAELKRNRNCDEYSLVLPYRTLSSGAGVATGAALLSLGVADPASRGRGAVDVVVGRYAYYVFEAPAESVVIGYTLTAASEVVVTINGAELQRYTGPSAPRTFVVPASGIVDGTNVLRFDCKSPVGDWRVSNLTVS